MFFILLSSTVCAQTDAFEGHKNINGADLFFNIKGKGENLLMLHGGPGLNHAYFLPHLTDLEKNFNVIYFDQRACGQSSIPSPDSISMQFLVEDIETIRKDLKIEKLNILAHSWGAVVATRYILHYPDRINKLIFTNPVMLSREYDAEAAKLLKQKATKDDSVARAEIISGGKLDSKKYEKLFLLSFNPSAYDKSNVAKINLSLPANFVKANTALFKALMKDTSLNANLYDSLKSFHFPVLIIHGQADIIPISSIERLKKEIPQAELEIFTQSGHFPFIEETSRYTSLVLRFLSPNK